MRWPLPVCTAFVNSQCLLCQVTRFWWNDLTFISTRYGPFSSLTSMGCYSPAWTLLEIDPMVSHLQLNYIPCPFFFFTLRHALAELTGCPGTYSVAQAALNLLTSRSASVSQVAAKTGLDHQTQLYYWLFPQGIALPSSISNPPASRCSRTFLFTPLNSK